MHDRVALVRWINAKGFPRIDWWGTLVAAQARSDGDDQWVVLDWAWLIGMLFFLVRYQMDKGATHISSIWLSCVQVYQSERSPVDQVLDLISDRWMHVDSFQGLINERLAEWWGLSCANHVVLPNNIEANRKSSYDQDLHMMNGWWCIPRLSDKHVALSGNSGVER